MPKYDVSDYGIFTDAVATTNSTKTTVESSSKTLKECGSNLNNDGVFMGPICDSCMDGFSQANSKLTTMSDSFSKVSNTLTSDSNKYQTTDKTEAKKVTGDSSKKSSNTTKASDYKNPGGLEGDQLDFVNSIKDGAVKAYDEYGVLPSLTLAQAILETGWGQSKIGNNIFGIKAGDSWDGAVQTLETGEQNPDGSRYTTVADFRDYDSIDDSIVDHAKLLNNDLYQPVLDAKNYEEACVAVRECGYATSLDYSDNLISLVEQYGLDQWDPQ